MSEQKKITVEPITATQDMELLLFPSKNGLSESNGFDVFYGEMKLSMLEHFDVEKNSDEIGEAAKMQRNVDSARVSGLTCYLTERIDYALPPIIIFVNTIDNVVNHQLKSGTVVEATLPRNAHRFIVDGQGRTYTVKTLLEKLKNLNGHGIGFMLFVTHTESIYDAETQIKQLFSDVNGKTKKPSTSLSLNFDSSKPFSRLIKEVTQAEIQVGERTLPVSSILSKQGTITEGKLWTYKQFSKFFLILFKETETKLNQAMADDDVYKGYVEIGKKCAVKMLNNLPIELLFGENWRKVHKDALFTKALFAEGYAYVGQSLIGESSRTGKMAWDKLDALQELPIIDLSAPCWLENNIAEKQKNDILTIRRKCHANIARYICHHTMIMPTMEI